MATGNDDNEWQKLPPDQKVQHKAWKARMTGYEECVKLFRTQTSDQSAEFARYVSLMKKFVVEAHENAREKALDAVFAFVEEAQLAGKTVSEVAPGVIGKCLNGRAKMKERAFDVLLMYVEIEKHLEIEEELIKGLDNKQPKIVQACLELLRKGLADFGSKILPIKPFLKQVIPLLDDRDKATRDEAKLLLVEIYRWIGKQTLLPLIQNVKPIQIQELEVEFGKLDLTGADKPRPTRFLRSQQDLRHKLAETDNANSIVSTTVNDDVEMQEELDPFELIEPVNIFDRLSKDFFDRLESKQWKDRKEVLDELLNILTVNLRPAPDSDYTELIKALKKIVGKDSNIPVVCVAAKCLTGLAKGLRQGFRNFAVPVIEVCLDRCREKKSNVLDAMRETCDAAYPATNLELLAEAVVTVLAHKTPIVRQCTQQFLTRAFAMATPTTLPKKVLKIYLSALIKNTGEADQTVRDSAFESLGMLWKCLGEKHVLPNLTDLDELKMNKIKEYAEKAVLLNLRGEPRLSTDRMTIAAAAPVQPAAVARNPTPAPTMSAEPTESARPKPVVVVKKKPLVIAKPPIIVSDSVEEKKEKEPRSVKVQIPITSSVSRGIPPRSKQPVLPTPTTNGKLSTTAKARPMTAPVSKPSSATTRTQHLIPVVPPAVSKTRMKPPVSSNRRSSTGPTITPISSNLQRQSTSTGGSTSSLSSTNTQASIPCVRSDTPTSSTSISLLRSVSNDIIASPVSSSLTNKSRIPVRAIPISLLKKSSS